MIIKVNKKDELKSIEELLISNNVSYKVFDNSHNILIKCEKIKANILAEFSIEIIESAKEYLFVNQEVISSNQVKINNIELSKDNFVVIAGPCSVEDYTSLNKSAKELVKHNLSLLRGGAYKPRTSPYSFLGLEDDGLEIMHQVSVENKLLSVSEIMSDSLLEVYDEKIDVLQIGARNMQNFALLTEVAKSSKPVILKRGFANTIEEWIFAAEYIVKGGNNQVILCERGIRTFEPYMRNTLDLSVITRIKQLTNLPIIIDPSHATGDASLILPIVKAAYVAGADGVMLEISEKPALALSDADQALSFAMFDEVISELKLLETVVKKAIV